MEKTKEAVKRTRTTSKAAVAKTSRPKVKSAKTSTKPALTQKKVSADSKTPAEPHKISKARLIGYGICLVILVILMIIAGTLMIELRNMDRPQNWIDCQPPLSEVEQARCDKAEAENYPYIAY